ncbi:MAG: hypothetical protein K0B15_13895 [Lentimicrobium sp.]|nr:hypothetical protein [Lentimicrobium sp.]
MKTGNFKFKILIASLVLIMAGCLPEDDLDPITGDIRDKFLGTWRFTEKQIERGTDDISFSVTISYDPGNSAQVLLRNFAQLGNQYSAYGIVTGNRITIPTQEVSPGFEVSGTGTMSTINNMNWEYTTTAGGDQVSYTAKAVK